MPESLDSGPETRRQRPKDLEYLFQLEGFRSYLPLNNDLKIQRRALINPVRGYIKDTYGDDTFLETDSLKATLVNKIISNLESENQIANLKEGLNVLWEAAISPEVGLDINQYVLEHLSLVVESRKSPKLSGMLLSLVERKYANSHHFKEKAFAASIIRLSPKYKEIDISRRQEIKNVAARAKDFSLEFVVGKSRKLGKIFGGDLNSWASLEWYRKLLPYYERGGGNEVDSSNFIKQNSIEMGKKLAKIENPQRRSRYSKSGVSLGIEIQGITVASVPQIGKYDSYLLTRFSIEDYQRVSRVANFYGSGDEFYEFSTRPSFSPVEISLLVQSLEKTRMINFEEGLVGVDINLGRLLFEPEKFREPMTLSLIMLAADYSNVPESASAMEDSWMEAVRAKPKYLGENMYFDFSSSVQGVKIRNRTELRLFAIKDLTDLYKTLLNIKELGDLAYENQQGKIGNKFNEKYATLWQILILDASKLFMEHGFPPPTVRWKYKDLKKLSYYASSEEGTKFVEEIRSVIKKARTRKRREDIVFPIMEAKEAEKLTSYSSNYRNAKLVEEGKGHRPKLRKTSISLPKVSG